MSPHGAGPYVKRAMSEPDCQVPNTGLYRFIFENAREATIVFDDSGRVLCRNRAARRLPSGLFERIFDAEAPWAHEVASFRKEIASSGRSALEVYLDDRIVSMCGEACGSLQVVTLHDLTESRRDEAKLRAFERIESVGLLTAGLVHDLNNLLMPIAATTACLLPELDDQSSAAEMVRDIQSAANRAVSLARQVLKLARRQPARVEELSLSTVLTELRPLVKMVAGPGVHADLALTENASLVRVDREQLERVVLNLIANARDAMPSGGRITVSTMDICLDGDRPAGATDGAYVALSVSDSGTGIRSEVRERIFSGSFTTKDANHGTGLGLASVRRFVAESRGCLAVHSQPGRGTAVSLYFPTVRSASESFIERAAPAV